MKAGWRGAVVALAVGGTADRTRAEKLGLVLSSVSYRRKHEIRPRLPEESRRVDERQSERTCIRNAP